MENNYFALLANDVKKLWNGLDGNQKLGMLALIVVTIVAATFFLIKSNGAGLGSIIFRFERS